MAQQEAREGQVVMWGTHGTSKSRAEAILEQGFITKPGRIGNGAYFWTAVNNSQDCIQLAHKLAKTWATTAQSRGQYPKESDLAVVQVGVAFHASDVLPLDDPSMTFRLWSLLKTKLSELLSLENEDGWKNVSTNTLQEHENAIHGFIEMFVLELEKKLGKRFKVIFKSQKCPRFSDPIMSFIGNHSCFAIRDTSVISSMDITH